MTSEIRAQVVIAGDAKGLINELRNSERELQEFERVGKKIEILDKAIQGAKDARAALVEARAEAKTLDEQLAAAKGAGAGAEAIRLLEQALKEANREVNTSEKAWDKSRVTLDKAREAAAAAGIDTKNLAAEQARLRDGLEAATAAVERNAEAILKARQASIEKAAADRAMAAEEQRLADIVEMNTTRQRLAAQELLEAERRTYAEAEAAAQRAAAARQAEAKAVEDYSARVKKALSDSFESVGIRGSAQIQAEILNIQQSLLKLGANAKVSGADFDRAFAEAKTRIAALEAEMNGTLPAMERMGAGAKSLEGGFGALTAQFAGFAVAMQAGQAFIHANSQVESLSRSLGILVGSSAKAAEELDYIRSTAQRLGVDVLEAGKAYTQLIAATQDTTLAGGRAREIFEAVAGAMSTLGKSSAETSNALLAVNQMASKGTVSLEELKGQLGEALPGALKAAAAGAGVTVSELTKMVETGSVLAEDMLPALAKGLREMYGVGKVENDTFVAQWARMKNSVTEFMNSVGDTGVMKLLNEGIALTAFSIKGLTVGLSAAIGKTRELFGGPQWDSEKARESLEQVARSSGLLSMLLDKTATSASRMGRVIREESQAALQLQNAFSKANEDLAKQITNLERLAGARAVEGRNAVEASRLYETEAQQRRTAVVEAEAQAAALAKVAEQTRFDLSLKQTQLAAEKDLADQGRKQITEQINLTESRIKALEKEAQARGSSSAALQNEIAGLQGYLSALKAERLGIGEESQARKERIETLEKEIEAKGALAEKSAQEAASSRLAVEQAKVAAATYGDQSKQVAELRKAHEDAAAAFERIGAAYVKGTATEKELTEARKDAQRTLVLYRDALTDATAAAERHVTVERSAATLQQSALQNDLYRANTILEVAKQRGNEKEIAQAQIAVWRIELQISEAQAEAARKEAEAMALVAKAKRAELELSGALTEAKKAELAVMDANVKAKQLEAEKFDLMADRMRTLAYETKELKSSMYDLSESTDRVAESASNAASAYDGLTSSIRTAGAAKDNLSRNTAGAVVEMSLPTLENTIERLKSLGVDETYAASVARMFFDAYGNVQNTEGRTLEEALQSVAKGYKEPKSGSGFTRRASQTTQQVSGTENQQVNQQADRPVVEPVFQPVKTYRVELVQGSAKASVDVLSDAQANSLAGFLVKVGAARS